jgi:hypothetical protein
VSAGFLQTVQLDGVRLAPPDAPIQCKATHPTYMGLSSTTTLLGEATTISTRGSSIRITCTRRPVPGPGGEQVFRQAVITLPTEFGNYNVLLPQDIRLPETMASRLEARIARLETELNRMKDSLRSFSPAGSIQIGDPSVSGAKKTLTGTDEDCPPGAFVIGGTSFFDQRVKHLTFRCAKPGGN